MPLSVRHQYLPLSSFIPFAFLLIQRYGKVHQHGRVVMIKEAVCLLNYVYAIQSEITELTVSDSYEYLGRGQRPSDIHTHLLPSSPISYLHLSLHLFLYLSLYRECITESYICFLYDHQFSTALQLFRCSLVTCGLCR